MVCEHLSELFQLCEENHLRLSGPDLIHIVCDQCGEKEVCPSVLTDEYDQSQEEDEEESQSEL